MSKRHIYKGINFRSLLEWDWARYLDWEQVEWSYEPKTFSNERGRYKPDFQVGNLPIYFEAKGSLLHLNRHIDACPHPLIFALGGPKEGQIILFLDGKPAHRFSNWLDAYNRATQELDTMTDRFKNYIPVAERLADAAPDIAQIETETPIMMTDAMGFIRARVALIDGRVATGMASFRLDLQGKGAQATNPIEDCETSAVGRALAFLGYHSNRAIASREDVNEAQRRASYQPEQEAPARSATNKTPQNPPRAEPKTPEEAEKRFYARFSQDIGGSEWSNVQAFLVSRAPKPTTIEGWIAVADAIRDKTRKEAQAA